MEIKSLRFARIDDNGRLCKVGSSRRPATFSSFKNAMKWDGVGTLVEIVGLPMSFYDMKMAQLEDIE